MWYIVLDSYEKAVAKIKRIEDDLVSSSISSDEGGKKRKPKPNLMFRDFMNKKVTAIVTSSSSDDELPVVSAPFLPTDSNSQKQNLCSSQQKILAQPKSHNSFSQISSQLTRNSLSRLKNSSQPSICSKNKNHLLKKSTDGANISQQHSVLEENVSDCSDRESSSTMSNKYVQGPDGGREYVTITSNNSIQGPGEEPVKSFLELGHCCHKTKHKFSLIKIFFSYPEFYQLHADLLFLLNYYCYY